MSDTLNLRRIEKQAFRSTHQDGLWDIYVGGVVLSLSALESSIASEVQSLLQFGLFLVGAGVFYLLFRLGKKYITTPRLGQVKFGPLRQRRKRTLAFVLLGIILLQLLILAGTSLLWINPQSATNLGLAQVGLVRERLIVATVGALFVGPSMVLIAYFNDFLRGYYIAFILALAVFSMIWFRQPIYLIVAALLIMIPGLLLFFRFLNNHPLPPAEVSHD